MTLYPSRAQKVWGLAVLVLILCDVAICFGGTGSFHPCSANSLSDSFDRLTFDDIDRIILATSMSIALAFRLDCLVVLMGVSEVFEDIDCSFFLGVKLFN